ncbi:hypothetical protein BDV24DRAFT_122059 [Aspergillus arachidicola]|uniref:Uncharacterized protein n=1 Tax=Aspergillus arachidicola TaxID=656916 RepID=A0A5N6YPH1_9EURO|nr:hypothetical protein BDV24DRAFT_122059 [Aspergillus arachidicola]
MHFTIRREEEINTTEKKKSADEPQEKRVLAQTQASGAKHAISTGLFKLKVLLTLSRRLRLIHFAQLIAPYIMAITATAVPQQVSYKYAPRWHRTYAAQALKSYYYSPKRQG